MNATRARTFDAAEPRQMRRELGADAPGERNL